MRKFGSDRIAAVMDKVGMDDTTPIDSSMVSSSIERAQKKVEAQNFSIRKMVLEYDDVINQQRQVLYTERYKVLSGADLSETITSMMEDVINQVVDSFAGGSKFAEDWDVDGLTQYAQQNILPQLTFSVTDLAGLDLDEIKALILDKTKEQYAQKEQDLGSEKMRLLERTVMLKIIDSKWMDHIDNMDQLRNGIGLRAYAQKNPLLEYKNEAFDAFQSMIYSMKEDVVRYMLRVKIVEPLKQRSMYVNNTDKTARREPVRRSGKKTGRNDPCPCGSGKKYKQCCGRAL